VVARERTRDGIARVALELFADKGYAGASVRDIAEAMGLTKAGVSYHFPAKDDLLHYLVEPVLEAVERVLGSASGVEPPSAREVMAAYLEVVLEHRQVVRLVVNDPAVVHHPSLGPRIADQHPAPARPAGGTRYRHRPAGPGQRRPRCAAPSRPGLALGGGRRARRGGARCRHGRARRDIGHSAPAAVAAAAGAHAAAAVTSRRCTPAWWGHVSGVPSRPRSPVRDCPRGLRAWQQLGEPSLNDAVSQGRSRAAGGRRSAPLTAPGRAQGMMMHELASGELVVAHRVGHSPSSSPWSRLDFRTGPVRRASTRAVWMAVSQCCAWHRSPGRSRSWSGSTPHSSR
jgi:AcrR family transcriptional regulator